MNYTPVGGQLKAANYGNYKHPVTKTLAELWRSPTPLPRRIEKDTPPYGMDQMATTAGFAAQRSECGSEEEPQGHENTAPTRLFYTAREEPTKRKDEVDVITRLIQKIDELAAEVSDLKLEEAAHHRKALRFLNTTESESGSERDTEYETPKERPRPRRSSWEQDLPKLTKILKTKELNPTTEEEYEDVMEEWELRCKGCGMEDDVLKHLMLHLGSPSIAAAVRNVNFAGLGWSDLKDEVARELFPFSDYARQLEKDMEKVERSPDIMKTIVKLTRLCARHKALCKRWERRNTFHDDRMKEALLVKLPKGKIAACMGIPDFKTISFHSFTRHCQMILAAADAEEACDDLSGMKTRSMKTTPVAVSAVDVAVTDSRVLTPPSRYMNPEQRCPNCGVHGHFLRNCPHPRIKCEVCGRSGHRKDICYKAQQEAPNGKVRTTYLRMTRSGIHIDLLDEATKRSLFEAMRRHLEGQEVQAARARERAAVKRVERRRAARESESPEEEPLGHEEEEISDMAAAAVACTPTPDVAEVRPCEIDKTLQPSATKYVDVEIFELKVPGLLDSGAVVSLLPESVWLQFPQEQKDLLALTEVGKRPISGLGGELHVKTIVDAPIIVAGRGILQRFFVSPNAGSIILGADALKGLGITMNFDTGEIYFDSRSKPIPESAMLGVSPLCVSWVSASEDIPAFKRGKGCTDTEAAAAARIFSLYPEVWKHLEVGKCKLTTHSIITGKAAPLTARARKLPSEKLKELQRQLAELQESGAIRKSESPWASPVVLVPKSNGKIRLCVDYRRLNAVTERDMYPLPRITDLLDRLGTATVFSTLDLTAGFHQILLAEESRKKTAFITPEGLYEFCVLPFGLTNAPSTFQRAMDCLFRNMPIAENVGVYLDDIVVFTATSEQHTEVLEKVCIRLKEAKLYVNLEKTTVYTREVKYLGFVVGQGSLHPDPEQIQALKDLKRPTDVTGVRRFLGLAGYFRRFIPAFSDKALPLTALLKKGVPFNWDESCNQAWQALKDELRSPTVRLTLPVPHKIFTLDTDASNSALGAVLLQEDSEGQLRPLAYASRTLTAAEINWTTREKEAFAIVWGILHFAQYLRWEPYFLVRSDHQSLRWLWRSENKRIIRWALLLQEYNFSIEYNKGTRHQHVDIFSRDVAGDEAGDKITDRIALRPGVFAIDDTPVGRTTQFPSFADIESGQKEECTPAVIQKHKLRKGAQGLYQTVGGKTYVPQKHRKAILYYFHFGKLGVHQGINKAYARIRRVFWWPGLRDEIQDYHNHCLTCARKRPQQFAGSRGHLLATHVGAIVAVDVVGPLETAEGFVNLLTIIDHFSKYAHAARLKEVTTSEIWEVLFTQWISYMGTPVYLLSDNATVFKSKEFQEQMENYGIKRLFSFPYHPQGNGVVEAFHLYLKKALTTVLRMEPWTVQQALANVLMAYRATPHAATGETPYFLVTGMDMVLPSMQDWTEVTDTPTTAARMKALRRLRESAFEQAARQAVARDAGSPVSKKDELEPGDLVLSWLDPNERGHLVKPPGGAKASPLWSGPCRVLRKLQGRTDAYVVTRLWEGGKAKEYRREDLMKIPQTWDRESAETAVKELMSDIKSPSRPGEPPERGVRSPRRRRSMGLMTSPKQMGQKLVEELVDPQKEQEGEEQKDEEEEPADREGETAIERSRQRSKKRKTMVQCVAWSEILGLFGRADG